MADKKIQIKDLAGNNLFPKTKASIVINNAGDNLGAVEAGAQVNVLEGVQLNGADVAIGANKKANIVLPAAAEYTIVKQTEAETGYASTYYLAKDGVQAGVKINLAKDQVLQNVELKTVETKDQPEAGFNVGDKYFDFTFQNKAEHIYLLAKDLMDIYEGSTYIDITGNVVSLKIADVKTAIQDTFYTETEVDNLLANKVDKLAVKPSAGTFTKVTINAEGQVTAGANLTEADVPEIHLTKVSDVTATAAEVNFLSGVTSNVQTQLDAKHPTIDAGHKLNADLVDDAAATNKFVTAAEKATWNAKQDALTFDATPTSGSSNPVTSGGVFAYCANFLTYEEIAE